MRSLKSNMCRDHIYKVGQMKMPQVSALIAANGAVAYNKSRKRDEERKKYIWYKRNAYGSNGSR